MRNIKPVPAPPASPATTRHDLRVAEPGSIGLLKERSLHAAVRAWYAKPGDAFEVRVGGYLIDIVRRRRLIEVQTRGLGAIRKKLAALAARHDVRCLLPIIVTKWLVKVDAVGAELSRRKSPKTGSIADLFYELVSGPELLSLPRFTLEVLFVDVEEVRTADGKGSWRRKGESIVDKRLVAVRGKQLFREPRDFLKLLPSGLPKTFTNKQLAAAAGWRPEQAARCTWALRKMEVLKLAGKDGRAHLHRIVCRTLT